MQTAEEMLSKYKAALSDFPGHLDEAAVEASLSQYISALGVERKVVRVRRGWEPDSYPDLRDLARKCMGKGIEDASRTAAPDARLTAINSGDSHAAFSVGYHSLTAWPARAVAAVRAAEDGDNIGYSNNVKRFMESLLHNRFWVSADDISQLSVYAIGAKLEELPEVSKWADPCFEAFTGGCWTIRWTEKTLYWAAKPKVHLDVQNQLHCEDGPALVCDIADRYFWHDVVVPEKAVMTPESMTIEDIDAENDSEVRRILIERMGTGKYLIASGARIVDMDHETALKGAADRLLLADKQGEKWLVGTDGSTNRVYYMPVPNNVKTCRQAHEAICGFDETLIVAKS